MCYHKEHRGLARSEKGCSVSYITVITTIESDEAASMVARTLVSERLAACVQRVPVDSCYRWNGEVIQDHEHLLLIKTTSERYLEVEQKIRELHTYEIPEIVQLRIERGFGPYLDWVEENAS